MITKVWDSQNDHGVKGQGQIYIKSGYMDCKANSSYIFDEGY